ncbi:MAG: ribonuclease J [Vigna little leaf phytoplasma]|nr:ribonuclease J [Vigna little leaf phytoplasma]
MQEINFSALGGLEENGKNFYLLKIKSSYFILDTGLKYPNMATIHGIDSVIPEYTRLDTIRDKIKGIFITSVLDTHAEALPYLIDYFKVPIYSSDFGIEVLKITLKKYNNMINLDKIDFKSIRVYPQVKIEDITISFFSLAHFLPETFGVFFDTLQNSIVYIGEMYFLQPKNKHFQTNFNHLVKLTHKRKVLALIAASQGAFTMNKQNQEEILEYNLSSYFASIENNIIISFLIPDLLKIQLVIDLAIEFNLKIAILGRKSEQIIEVALQKSYLKIPKGFLVNLKQPKDYLKYKNLIVIVVGKRFEPFYRLQRMCKCTDRLMALHPKDKILLLSIGIAGIDKIQTRTLDLLARNGFVVDILIKDLFTASYNYEENFKLLLHLLDPCFLLPVAGEYRHQHQIKKIAKNFNFPEENIFMLENGDNWIYDFKNKPIVRKHFFKNLSEILIDGTPVLEGNDYILKDRELLANDGIIIVACNIDLKNKKISGNIELISKGFLEQTKIIPILTQLKTLFLEISNDFLNKNKQFNKWNDFKSSLRENLPKFIFKETKKKPIIIPVLILINN